MGIFTRPQERTASTVSLEGVTFLTANLNSEYSESAISVKTQPM